MKHHISDILSDLKHLGILLLYILNVTKRKTDVTAGGKDLRGIDLFFLQRENLTISSKWSIKHFASYYELRSILRRNIIY